MKRLEVALTAVPRPLNRHRDKGGEQGEMEKDGEVWMGKYVSKPGRLAAVVDDLRKVENGLTQQFLHLLF